MATAAATAFAIELSWTLESRNLRDSGRERLARSVLIPAISRSVIALSRTAATSTTAEVVPSWRLI